MTAHGRGFWTSACAAAHAIVLTLWISALIAAGVSAAGTFSTLPDLGVTLRGYSALGNDPAEHGRLAAGKVMEPIFTTLDLAQIPLAALAVITLILEMLICRERRSRAANILRSMCVCLATALLAAHIAFIAPPMNRDLRAYWSAAEQGDAAAARAFRAAFDEQHPRAELVLKVNLALLLVAMAAAAWAGGRHASTSASELETPLLARRHP